MSNAIETFISRLTVADLSRYYEIPVSTVIERVAQDRVVYVPPPLPKTKVNVKVKASKAPGEVNTRTPAGRQAYQKAVLQAVARRDSDVKAKALRPSVGGTPAQLRTACNALVKKKLLKSSGQAAGTTYRATEKGHKEAKA